MMLTDLKREIDKMIERCDAAGIDASQMEVKVWGERGVPHRIEAQWIDGDVETTIRKPLGN